MASTATRQHNVAVRSKYDKIDKIGEGTFAAVFLARNTQTGAKVAIKKIKTAAAGTRDGIDITAMREFKYLKELHHPNVVALLDVFSSGGASPSINLVLEYLNTDLEATIKDRSLLFSASDVKSWMQMLCRGIEYCHRNWCLHRDLKPNNLLISPQGELKIADFGLARGAGDPGARMTSQVVTRWYRAPELLLGSRAYSGGVDMWAIGCIFAELLLRTPYLPGESDSAQLTTIFRALGTPTSADWPQHQSLPGYHKFEQFPKQNLSLLFTAASTEAIEFLGACLRYDPLKRLRATEALQHAYFQTGPLPTLPVTLPRPAASVEQDAPSAPAAPAKATSNGAKRILPAEEVEKRKRLAHRLAFS
ncbi:[pyruvate dehydrogenase (acetyl-transferring)] kinase [Malassezia vespertilionis]|uniref:[RNA-polymerase]-subunit kinase n=1 Tax=Malassezia vespertilionis TaxID=2020962 RepID=A0A2N1JE09_9BASI|nr:[pyruvate dehydrogenase (acetyl-transferring)] kinase [Malassezia vespertilionis]PKI84797.1 Kin28p [Malassezia vespertilionis]WFD05544.1 [pyruvate dehydrogenase (acetyl-transferring)] kinase [Malassezia vespertilionis]